MNVHLQKFMMTYLKKFANPLLFSCTWFVFLFLYMLILNKKMKKQKFTAIYWRNSVLHLKEGGEREYGV